MLLIGPNPHESDSSRSTNHLHLNASRLLLSKMEAIYQTYQRKIGNVLIVDHLEEIFSISLSEFTIWSDRYEILLYDTTKQFH